MFADDAQQANDTARGGCEAMMTVADCDLTMGISRATHKQWHAALVFAGEGGSNSKYKNYSGKRGKGTLSRMVEGNKRVWDGCQELDRVERQGRVAAAIHPVNQEGCTPATTTYGSDVDDWIVVEGGERGESVEGMDREWCADNRNNDNILESPILDAVGDQIAPPTLPPTPPPIPMEWDRGRGEVIPWVDPYVSRVYLGQQSSAALDRSAAVKEARALSRRAACMIDGAGGDGCGKKYAAEAVIRPSVMYKLKHLACTREEMEMVERPIKGAIKRAVRLPISYPDGLVGGKAKWRQVEMAGWYDGMMIERMVMLMSAMTKEGWGEVRRVMRVIGMEMQEDGGELCTVWGGEGGVRVHPKWEGSWLGQMVTWMSEMEIEVRGVEEAMSVVSDDALVASLVPQSTQELVQEIGGWAGIVWCSQVVVRREMGDRREGVHTKAGIEARWREAEVKVGKGSCWEQVLQYCRRWGGQVIEGEVLEWEDEEDMEGEGREEREGMWVRRGGRWWMEGEKDWVGGGGVGRGCALPGCAQPVCGILAVYSDGSVDAEDDKWGRLKGGRGGLVPAKVKRGVKAATYAWVVAGIEEEDGVVLQDAEGQWELGQWMGGSGVVDGNREDMDSTRAEAQAVVAAMGALLGRWTGEVVHRLDNKGVVDRYNDLRYGANHMEGWEMAHGDVWEEIRWLRAKWGGRYKLEWSRGHPEKDEKKGDAVGREGWSVHDHFNHECDREADRIYNEYRKWDIIREYGGGDGLQVWVGGRRLQNSLRKRLQDHLAVIKIKGYLGKSMGRGEVVDGEQVEGQEVEVDGDGRRRWANKEVASQLDWDLMSEAWGTGAWGAEAQAKASKLMHGWVATMRVLHKRREVETEVCPCCGSVSESAFHLKMECTHDKMVEIRSSRMSQMRKAVEKALIQGGARKEMAEAVGRMWTVDSQGKMIRWEGMEYASDGGDWEQQVDRQMGITDGGVASDRQVVVRDIMAGLALVQPADLREGGWMMKRWGVMWEEEGISRYAAAAAARAILLGLERMYEDLWVCRNDLAHDKIDKHKNETKEIWYNRIWDRQDKAGCRRTARDILEMKKMKQLRKLDKDVREQVEEIVRRKAKGGALERMGWLNNDNRWIRRGRRVGQVAAVRQPEMRQRQLWQIVGQLDDVDSERRGSEAATTWNRVKRTREMRQQRQQATWVGRQRDGDIRRALQATVAEDSGTGEGERRVCEEGRGVCVNPLADERTGDEADMQQRVLHLQQGSSND